MSHSSRELSETVRERLALHPELRLALLFGSRASGTARPDSDLDLAVEGEDIDLLGLGAELHAATGIEVDVVRLSDAGVPLLQELVRTAAVVHEGAPGAAAAWRSRTLLALEVDGPWYLRMRDAWLARVAEQGL